MLVVKRWGACVYLRFPVKFKDSVLLRTIVKVCGGVAAAIFAVAAAIISELERL